MENERIIATKQELPMSVYIKIKLIIQKSSDMHHIFCIQTLSKQNKLLDFKY